MGCDIHSYVEIKNLKNNKWESSDAEVFPCDNFEKLYYKKNFKSCPFDYCSYAIFGFLADVRNYSCCDPISKPKGLPSDTSEDVRSDYNKYDDYHSYSYLTAKELMDFDYSKTFWDRRITRDGDGAALANENEGKMITYKDHLGEWFFKDLEALKSLGDLKNVRVVFWFDN